MKSNLKKRVLAFALCMIMVMSSASSVLADDANAANTVGVGQEQSNNQESGQAVSSNETDSTQTGTQEQTTEGHATAPETTTPETAGEQTAPETSAATPEHVTPEMTDNSDNVTEPEIKVQEAMELKQEITDANGQIIDIITANIPEATFDANTSEVTMEVLGLDAAETETIKGLMEKSLAENKILGEYFLYKINFKVNGETVKPLREIKITFEKKHFKIGDTKKANFFYYNEAAEITEVTQRAELIEALHYSGQSTENIEDYDITDITLNEDGTVKKIETEGRLSTIYGCYIEEDKPVDVKPEEPKTEEPKIEEPKEEPKTEDTVKENPEAEETKAETVKYEDDEVTVTVSADEKGIIPENTKLQVVPIRSDNKDTEEQYKEVEDQLNKKAENEEYDIAGFLAYDISFVNEKGEEVEPGGEVKVTIDYKNEVIPAEVEESSELDVTVMHLEEKGTGTVQEVVDMVADETKEAAVETTEETKVTKVELKTDSFSVFTITWTRYGSYARYLKFNYVDAKTGKGIDGPSDGEYKTKTGTIQLAEYQAKIDGYSHKITTIDSYDNKISVTSIKRTENKFYYNESKSWSGSGNNIYNVYFVYEKISDISVVDNIMEDGSLTAECSSDGITSYTWLKSDSEDGDYEEVERVEYHGNVSNISKDGKKLYPTYDKGARKWYKVKVTLKDGTTQMSKPKHVVYYAELENGSFETPQIATGNTSTHTQLSNAYYKSNGGVWQTTGTNGGKDIEIIRAINGANNDEKSAYAWNGVMAAVDKNQFAELNCEAAGALYQDVLTYSGQSLNWWLSHRARGVKKNSTLEHDTMYLVIMPTSVAMTAGDKNSELDTQDELQDYLESKGINIGTNYGKTESQEVRSEDEEGVYVYRITSDDQSWNSVKKLNDYIAKSSLTRFFFVAGRTASKNNTIGNFLDEVGFSQELPPVKADEFSIEIMKKFEGLDNAGLNTVRNNIQFEISATDKETNKELTEEEITNLFGTSTVIGTDMSVKVDGSLYYSIANKKITNGSQYNVKITEVNAGLSGYELTTTAKTTVTHDGESTDSTKDSVIDSLQGKTTAKVEFTNSYRTVNYKNVNFTKIWDDNKNNFQTRPDSLNVTLKASIVVENEQGNAQTIDLDNLAQSATLTAAGGWKTSWKVPVYYDYNGVNVKINYTVEEGAVDSNYVYEAANQGIAQSGDGKDYKKTDFGNVVTESEEEPALISNRSAVSLRSGLYNVSAESAQGSEDTGLGQPAHNKYIEYNESTAEYTLNLDVTGAKGEAKGADILFIIDRSGSMGTGKGSTYNNLLPSVKTLLTGNTTGDSNGIIDRIFATKDNVNSVAYVSFSDKDGTSAKGWYQTGNKATLKKNINDLKASGGTNWTYAMQQASSLLKQKENSENEKVVIFLSDGKPTYSMDGKSETGNGSDTKDKYYTEAANVVKNSSYLSKAKMYSVYLTTGTASGMRTFSEKVGNNSELVNGTDLKDALDKILNKVIPTYKNVVITDVLSDYVEFAETNPTITVKKKTSSGMVTTLGNNEFNCSINDKNVTVSLLNGDSLEDGATYTVSFKVKPSEKANIVFTENNGYLHKGDAGTGITSAGKEGFYSNVKDSTRVSYTVNEKNDSATYPMPVVQVTTHELNYIKVWKYPDSVAEPTEDVILDVVYTDGTRGTITLKKESNYKQTETVPVTKKISSITEKKIDGYTASYQINDTEAVVTNSYSKVTTSAIQVTKKWIGGTSRNSIDVSLYRSKGDESAEKYKTVTLNEQNNWTYMWNNLPLKEGNGEDEVSYTYAVREENTPENYTSNIVYETQKDQTNVTITNVYDSNCTDENYYIVNVLQTEKVTLNKVWDDNNNDLNVRPNVLKINVTGINKTLSFYLRNPNWEKTVTLLKQKNADYTAEEELNSDYYEQVSNDRMTTEDKTIFSFENKIKTTSLTVHKEWNDGEIETRPESITFTLQYRNKNSNGAWEDYGTYNMIAENIVGDIQWTKEIGNLPTIYEYQVKEGTTDAAYYSKVTNSDNVYTITNTLKWGVRKTSTPIGDREAEPLSGAEFELKQNDSTIATGKSVSDGTIEWELVEGIQVNLNELNGVYTIHETKAPTGYVISGDWTLEFANGLLTKLDGKLVKDLSESTDSVVMNSTDGVVISITNDAIYELPSTGGMGIYWYSIGGMILMIGASLILYKNKSKEVLRS